MRASLLVIGKALLFFILTMAIGQGFVALNAGVSPKLPWFPIPALAFVWFASVWAHRRWDIGIARPAGSLAAGYAFSLLLTAAILCFAVIESWYHELVLPAPQWPDPEVSSDFQLAFLVVVPLVAAVLAEVAFRGIMQRGLEPLMSLWPMLGLIAVLNMLMHFYDPQQFSQAFRLISLNLAWGYVTWRTGSIRPALLGHLAMNVFVLSFQYFTETFGAGPPEYAALSPALLTGWVLAGILAAGAALYFLRRLPART